MSQAPTYAVFTGHHLVATGPIEVAVLACKAELARNAPESTLCFEDRTGESLDFDLRGSDAEVIARLAHHPYLHPTPAAEVQEEKRGPGRPRLGVVPREVTLLPRHWEWLNAQPGGASKALRTLVDEARQQQRGQDEARQRLERTHRVMWSIAGNLPHFEEASRALFASDFEHFTALIAEWPAGLRAYLQRLLEGND